MLVTALALFFSTFSSPLLATLLTSGCGWRAISTPTCGTSERWWIPPRLPRSRAPLYYVLPNLAPFDVKAEVVYGMPIALRHVAYTLAYAAVYITTLLTAAVAIFRRRDFK